jgi:hypothetical protein
MEKGSDGVRRMVIIDIPERGPEMPATNVDAFVQRTRHFVFLRHPDRATAEKLAEAAVATVGNITEFDLNFRTERVLKAVRSAGRRFTPIAPASFIFVRFKPIGPGKIFFRSTKVRRVGTRRRISPGSALRLVRISFRRRERSFRRRSRWSDAASPCTTRGARSRRLSSTTLHKA